MNWRNVQIFGLRALRPEKRHITVTVSILVFIALVSWIVLDQRGSNAAGITGAATSLPLEQSIQQTQQESKNTGEAIPQPAQEQSKEAFQEPLPEQEKAFYEYGGKCAADVKRAESDVGNVNNYLGERRSEYESLKGAYTSRKAELEALLAQLEQEYTPQITRAEQRTKEAEQDLARVEENLKQVRAVCEPAQ